MVTFISHICVLLCGPLSGFLGVSCTYSQTLDAGDIILCYINVKYTSHAFGTWLASQCFREPMARWLIQEPAT